MTTSDGLGALAVITLLVLTSCSSDGRRAESPPPSTPVGPVASAGCEGGAVAEPGVSDRTITSGGVERVFQLQLPDSYDGATPLPVVLGLHPLTVSNAVVPAISGFADVAQTYDFIAVFPSGRLDGSIPYWHAAPEAESYDVDFVAELLDLLESGLCVDVSRVYSTGMSNGGQMSSLLACRLSERIAAVAPIAGVEFFEECEGEPVPVIAFHGTADPIVTYEGGGLNATTISNTYFWKGDVPPGLPEHGGVDEAMRRWADHNGCDPEPVEERVSPEVWKRTWRGCDAETMLYVVDGGGHSYPGRPVPGFENMFGHTTTDVDATTLMFDFFFGAAS